MNIPRQTLRLPVLLLALSCSVSAWANGDGFFRTKEIRGNPQYVVFGSVRDEQGAYLYKARVTVSVAEHMLEVVGETDVIGRFRTPDVGLSIKDLGYQVDPSLITISIECPGYQEVRREYRLKRGQKTGAIEVNFRMKKSVG